MELKIFNSLGQEIRTLLNNNIDKGEYTIIWDGRDERGQLVSSDVYFYKLKGNDFVESRKMVILK